MAEQTRKSRRQRAVQAIRAEFTDVLEAADIDEFYPEMTGAERSLGSLPTIAQAIQQRILGQY